MKAIVKREVFFVVEKPGSDMSAEVAGLEMSAQNHLNATPTVDGLPLGPGMTFDGFAVDPTYHVGPAVVLAAVEDGVPLPSGILP